MNSFFFYLEERRASANEALLGLNNYAHLLAACSTMGISATEDNVKKCSTITDTQNLSTASPTLYNQSGRSVEEESETYFSQQGFLKRNTVSLKYFTILILF